jgi:hypothetical protein
MSDLVDAVKPRGNRANLTNEGKGRVKGSQNKFTTTLKDAILASFDRVGGVDYLEKQARENPQAYMSLLAKVLPMQITGPNNGPIMLITGVIRSDEEAELFEKRHGAIDPDHDQTPDWPRAETPQVSIGVTRSDEDAGAGADEEADQAASEAEPAVEMRAYGTTRHGLVLREALTAPPTHAGRTVVTESGMRIRTADPVDED